MTATNERAGRPLTVEPANRGELLTIYRIEQQCFPQPWPYTAFEHHLDAVAFLVGKRPARIVGYVVGDLVDGFPGSVGHIKDLAVRPAHRREGVGRRLLSRAMFELDDAGAVRAELEVRRGNEAARALYEEFGFERRSTRPEYYSDGEDAIVLSRPLDSRNPALD